MYNNETFREYDRVITTDEFFSEENCNFNSKTISYTTINGNSLESKRGNSLIFNDVTFTNVTFMYGSFTNCEFNNCKFINCDFFDYNFGGNSFNACHFDNMSFYNNTIVVDNKFVGCTGNARNFFAIAFAHNIFMNMDFSGFLPLYINREGNIMWRNNYFINTIVNVDSLKQISDNAQAIYSGRAFFCSGRRIMESFSYTCLQDFYNIFVVHEYFGEMASIRIDLQGVDDISKLNLVSNCFTNYHVGHVLTGVEGKKDSKIQHLQNGKIHTHTVPNPRPLKIVDNRGYVLKDGVIKDISFTDRCIPEDDVYGIRYPGVKLTGYTEENNLLNPNNYSCRSLIRRQ